MGEFDVEAALTPSDPGTRLAGHARLYARPDGDFLNLLTEAVFADEHLPFSQYRGLQAIAAVVDEAGGGTMRLENPMGLKECLSRLPQDGDRNGVLERLLAKRTFRRA
ncbi:hypothetical protein [Streptomyces sp. NPDC055134]